MKCWLFLKKCLIRGVEVSIIETHRSDERQAALYAQGRTAPGPRVTWTKVSRHQRKNVNGEPASDAFDAVPLVNGKITWTAPRLFAIMGDIAKELDLRWGGNWDGDDKPGERGENDSCHFEFKRTS